MRYVKVTVNVTKVTCLVRRFDNGAPQVETKDLYLDGRCTDLTRALRRLRTLYNTDTLQVLAADSYEIQTERYTMSVSQFIKLAKQKQSD